jgi:hypothetical protein
MPPATLMADDLDVDREIGFPAGGRPAPVPDDRRHYPLAPFSARSTTMVGSPRSVQTRLYLIVSGVRSRGRAGPLLGALAVRCH